MAAVTYFAVLPFLKDGEGDLFPLDAVELQSSDAGRGACGEAWPVAID